MIEWHREDLALITNLPVRELSVVAVGQDRLPEIPLLAPSAGLIAEFPRRWYGSDFTTRLRIVAEVDSIYYGLALLRSQLVHGALICARAAADAALEGRLPGGPGLRLIPWPTTTTRRCSCWPGSSPVKASASCDDTYPLNLLWDAFTTHTQHRST